MATSVQIPDDQLQPGDLVDVEYEIMPGAAPAAVAAAIHDVKAQLAHDRRFVYQGSQEFETQETETGALYKAIIITVMVADPSKRTGSNPPPAETQQAGFWIPVTVIVALVTSAVIAWRASVVYVGYTLTRRTEAVISAVDRIRNDPNMTPDQKQAALDALGATKEEQKGLSAGIAAFGGSLVTAALIIGVVWAVSLSGKGRAAD